MSPLAKVGVLPVSAVLLDVSVLLDSAALGIRQAEKNAKGLSTYTRAG